MHRAGHAGAGDRGGLRSAGCGGLSVSIGGGSWRSATSAKGLKAKLRIRAAEHGRSMEAEVRAILAAVLPRQ
ncbi:FitA-like ribbon-helix-helix domain-containing protein [Lentzea terrae]|uniref:FitA-like ribbon-helix-helix domain-containing protein n=1 Tax=Lentzea terrae TaxID=2200761 RepID=UPI0038CC0B4F